MSIQNGSRNTNWDRMVAGWFKTPANQRLSFAEMAFFESANMLGILDHVVVPLMDHAISRHLKKSPINLKGKREVDKATQRLTL